MLVAVLVVTNVAALAAALWLWQRSSAGSATPATSAPDAELRAVLAASPRPPSVPAHLRRVISVEILNPVELAVSKGRLAAVAGSLAPGLTRRIVYDQAVKTLRKQLLEQHVHAEVLLHELHPPEPEPVTGGPATDLTGMFDHGPEGGPAS